MTRNVLYYALLAGAGVLALKLLVVFLEPRLAFFPIRGETVTPRQLEIAYQEAWVRTSDGENIHVWVLEPRQPVAEVVFFHGNGGNLSLWLEVLADLHDRSLRVIALDYRGFGRSTGSPSEEGLYRDTEALVRHFWANLHRPRLKTIYWGRSLGGVMAGYAATVRVPDALILEATFPDKASLLRYYPLLRVLSPLSRYEFPTARFAYDLEVPILVIHGDRDEIVPYSLGVELYQGLANPKQFQTVRGARHNDIHLVEPSAYWNQVLAFIGGLRHGPHSD